MIVQSKPVAQVYRLFAALVALLLVMGIGFSVARWRAAETGGSPYGALTAVAPGTTPSLPVPARVAALPAPSPAPAPVVAASTPAADPAVVQPSAPAVPPVAAPAATPVVDSTRTAPRVIALGKSDPGAAPLPAPAAAVAAATAAQNAPAAMAAAPVPVRTAAAAVADDTAAANAGPGGMVNINTASVEALNHLPGVGRIGKTIVRHRPYSSVQDLVDHRVLRAGDLARIRTHITAN